MSTKGWKPEILQLHHQFRDGHTDFCRQFTVTRPGQVHEVIRETQASHPVPEGAQWLLCWEGAPQFLMVKAGSAKADT